ncbi:hypothetical protein N801_11750 [Knoellia aerolata DSM 18566]|uniref:GerMN domain-containing protein n=1 Tax=Knoellia aerolata DSM 18566 TaxID=1385519 RepID=A0A0A0JZJ1_9MICO|nr:hypothetical protein N801_11750 [Knoellia aerolata DSM 18566]
MRGAPRGRRDLRAQSPGRPGQSRGRGMTCAARGKAIATLVAALVAACSVAACGAPSGSPARTIESVPYDLTAPAPSASSTNTPGPSRGPQVFLLRDEALLAASPVPPGTDVRASARRALEQLVEGPTDRDRTAGFSTALGPEVRLSLSDLADGRATIDIRLGDQALGAGRLPLAVGQIVLTLTSVVGVDEVVLTAGGARIAAPLPGGALTDRPLRARDYAELVMPPTAPTTAAAGSTGARSDDVRSPRSGNPSTHPGAAPPSRSHVEGVDSPTSYRRASSRRLGRSPSPLSSAAMARTTWRGFLPGARASPRSWAAAIACEVLESIRSRLSRTMFS